jgi:hypothetical protein
VHRLFTSSSFLRDRWIKIPEPAPKSHTTRFQRQIFEQSSRIDEPRAVGDRARDRLSRRPGIAARFRSRLTKTRLLTKSLLKLKIIFKIGHKVVME